MQYKEGLVVAAEICGDPNLPKKDRINPVALFGPRTSPAEICEYPYERLITNDITFFDSVSEAGPSYHSLACRGKVEDALVEFLGYAQVTIEIADSPNEWELIKDSSSIIVVAGIPEDRNYKLLGKWCEGIAGVAYAPTSSLELNGVEPFRTWREAERAWTEVRRQGHILAKIARFSFNGISRGRRRP